MSDLGRKQASSNTKIVGSDPTGCESNFMEVTPNQDGHVLDRSDVDGNSAQITINNVAKIANVSGASNLVNRKTIIIQPLQSVCFVGFSAGSQPHRIPRRTIVEFKIGANVDLYIKKNGAANHNVAVSELS